MTDLERVQEALVEYTRLEKQEVQRIWKGETFVPLSQVARRDLVAHLKEDAALREECSKAIDRCERTIVRQQAELAELREAVKDDLENPTPESSRRLYQLIEDNATEEV